MSYYVLASYNEAKCKALKAQSTSDLSATENLKFKFKTKNKKNYQNSKKPPLYKPEYSSAPEFSGRYIIILYYSFLSSKINVIPNFVFQRF